MEVMPLEIRLIKAHDLKDVNLISKMDVYAVASLSGDQLNNPNQKTNVDKDCGTSPKWDFSMKFTVDEAAVLENRLTLKIKLISNRSLGDREIGVVYVQIKELFDNTVNGVEEKEEKEEEKSGSYSVRLANGKAKGTLDLAYKFGEKYKFEPPPPPSYGMKAVDAQPVMAYPPAFAGASSSAYPPPQGGYPPPPGAYPYPPQQGAYPPPPQGVYPPPPQGAYPPPSQGAYPSPPPPGYGYPPPLPGYGYGGYPPQGYGHPPMQPPKKPKKSGGAGLGLGLGAGLLGGLLIGDMMSDVGEMAAYDAGYDAAFGDGGF